MPYLNTIFNAEESICKQVKFNPAVSGKALKGHTLETYKVGLDEVCQLRCAAHDLCTSYNLGPRNRGWHDCEISKSDAIRHPNDLTTHSGYIYREIVVSTERILNLCYVFLFKIVMKNNCCNYRESIK